MHRRALSQKFRLEILKARANGERQYMLALLHGLNPSVFSLMLHGAAPVPANDPRILALGAKLGLQPDECFDNDSDKVFA